MVGRRGRSGLKERGQMLVLGALAMAALMGFVGLAVDVGLYLVDRRELQNAADAAALAAVAYLPGDAAAAEAAAQNWAENNGMDPDEIESVTDCQDGVLDDSDTCVRVKVRRDSPTIFFRVFGLMDADVSARAAAQTGSALGASGLTPFGVLDDFLTASTRCQYRFTNCQEVTLKYDSTNEPPNSNFGALRLNDPEDGCSSGASCLKSVIKGGSKTPLCSINQNPRPPESECPTERDVEPGNMRGPVKEGVEWRLDPANNVGCNTLTAVVDESGRIKTECNPWGPAVQGDTDSDGATCDNLSWDEQPRGSCRIIAIPAVADLAGGSHPEDITEFALFWLNSIQEPCKGNHCEVRGYFIQAEVSVTGLLGNLDPSTTPFEVRKLVE